MYIGPEFQLGQVYDGTLGQMEGENVVLYRPVYAVIRKPSVVETPKEKEGSRSETSKASELRIKQSH